MLSEWSDFQALDDNDNDGNTGGDILEYAKEEDSQEYKAQVGASLEAPSIEWNAEPIRVPQGNIILQNGTKKVCTQKVSFPLVCCVFSHTSNFLSFHSFIPLF
jgi:sortase (surface protein transpeptidase)